MGWNFLALLMALGVASSCDSSRNPADDDGGPDAATTSRYTYYQHVAPILEARCAGCHVPGGIGPFSMTDLGEAVAWSEWAAIAVEERVMPPFPADDTDCRQLSDRRNMSDAERAMFIEWARNGTPAGDPDLPAEVDIDIPDDQLGPPTRVFDDRVAYQPDLYQGSDEYRCFWLDPELTAEWTFMKSVGLDADNWARIHHAIVYAVPPASREQARAREASEERPGWECYFGPEVDGAFPVGGYTPGAIRRAYVGGTAVPLAAGTTFAVEMHFHDTNNQAPVSFGVASWEFEEPVTRFPGGLDFFTSEFFIPAGDPDVRVTVEGRFVAADEEPAEPDDPNEVRQAREGLVWGVDFHMHMRGKTARVDLVRADGARECLLWVPDWSDEWQGSYSFAEPIRAHAGDRIEATCHWDNSADNQPIVDGQRLDPVDLTWGFDALQEMCNGGVALTHE